MIEEGTAAPEFELPAVVDGTHEPVALADSRGRDVVVLAFYPGDFNPACEDGSSGLDELDLLTMQKDVTVVGISGDSVHSHTAFAEAHDLQIPLLSDGRGEVAADYGVAVDDPDAGRLVDRAVVVVDLAGDVVFTWSSEDPTALPPVDAVRDAVEGVGGDRASESRYRMGHAHYVEGRRAFTSAMNAFGEDEWMLARGDFDRAETAFTEAADHFNAAVRFAEEPDDETLFERAEEKAETLWQAAEWLGAAANAYASGRGAEGESRRRDAERPLEEAREIHEPIPPDEFPPDADPAELEREAEETDTILPSDPPAESASLDVDIDAAAEEASADDGAAGDDATPASAPAPDASEGASMEGDRSTEATADAGGASGSAGPSSGRDEASEDEGEEAIDEAELEEITAELEEQTEQAQAEHGDESLDAVDDPNLADADADALAGEDSAADAPADAAGSGHESPDGADGAGDGNEAETTEGEDTSLDLELTDPTDEADVDGDEAADEDGEEDEEQGEDDDDAAAGDPAWSGGGL